MTCSRVLHGEGKEETRMSATVQRKNVDGAARGGLRQFHQKENRASIKKSA